MLINLNVIKVLLNVSLYYIIIKRVKSNSLSLSNFVIKMSKKRTADLDIEVINNQFEDFKRLKVDFNVINDLIKEKHPDLDTTNYEIYKLTIFEALLSDTSFDNNDSEDGVQDIIILIVTTLLNLLKDNIGKLDLPNKIKTALTKLQEVLNKNGKNKSSTQDGTEQSEQGKSNS